MTKKLNEQNEGQWWTDANREPSNWFFSRLSFRGSTNAKNIEKKIETNHSPILYISLNKGVTVSFFIF